jgi:hypothetical protein
MNRHGYVTLALFGLMIVAPFALTVAALSGWSISGRPSELLLPAILFLPILFGLTLLVWGAWATKRKSIPSTAARLLLVLGALTLAPNVFVLLNFGINTDSLRPVAPFLQMLPLTAVIVPFCGAFMLGWGLWGLMRLGPARLE